MGGPARRQLDRPRDLGADHAPGPGDREARHQAARRGRPGDAGKASRMTDDAGERRGVSSGDASDLPRLLRPPRRRRPGRLPPGQYLTRDFPVLSAGPTPKVHLERWSFTIEGEIDEPRTWTWDELQALPDEEFTVDIHCVTKWTKLDTTLEGRLARHAARRRRDRGGVRDVVLRRRLHDEPAARGPHRTARRGSPTATTASRSSPSTAARCGCSCRTCTSGRARSGCAACG